MKKATLLIFLLILITMTNISFCYADIDTDQVKSMLIYDQTYDEFMLQKDDTTQIFPASITKIITAILVLENVDDLDKIVTVSESAVSQNRVGGSTTNIQAGEELSFIQLLHALLIRSGNEVSYILAEEISGEYDTFVKLMNDKATSIGLTDTHFSNPCGLHEPDHYSTANDLLKLAIYAMKNPVFADIVSTKNLSLTVTNLHTDKGWADAINTNLLLSDPKYYSDEYAITGVKTGSTPFAGYCLLSSAHLEYGNDVYMVVIGAKDEDSLYGFNKNVYDELNTFYDKKMLYDTNEIFADLLVGDKKVSLYSNEDIYVLVPKNWPISRLDIAVTTIDDISLPMIENDILGKITVSYNGNIINTFDLISKTNLSQEDMVKNIEKETDQDVVVTNNTDPVKSSVFSFDRTLSLIMIILSSSVLLILLFNDLKRYLYKK